jgi:hypothetical protein
MSVQKQVEQQEGERRQQQVAFVQSGYGVLTQLGVVDARDKITCGDLVRRILQEKVSTESCGKLASIEAGATPPDDLSVLRQSAIHCTGARRSLCIAWPQG